jgi:AcrR family transcriptional regulator
MATDDLEPTKKPSSGAAGGTSGRRLLRREERRAQLLRAAATAFARGGFAATSMDDVAAEAGVTRLIVYRNFDSKEDLYRSVLQRVADRLGEEVFAGLGRPPEQRRGVLSAAMLRVAREDPDAYRLFTVHAAREPQFAALAEEFRAGGLRIADELIGATIPDPVTKAWAGRVIVDYLQSSVLAWLDLGEEARDDEFVEQTSDGLMALFVTWADPDRLPPALRRAVDRVRAENA